MPKESPEKIRYMLELIILFIFSDFKKKYTESATKNAAGKSVISFVEYTTSNGKKLNKNALSNPAFSLNKSLPKLYIKTIDAREINNITILVNY